MNKTRFYQLLSAVFVLLIMALLLLYSQAKDDDAQAAAARATETRRTEDQAAQARENAELKSEVQSLRDDLESDPKFVLRQIDRSLDALQRGDLTVAYINYSDGFAMKIEQLRSMGVSRKRLRRRTNRLIALATQGKFLGNYEEELVRSGGIAGLRADVTEHLR
jgi:hypothetical protein